MGAAKEARDRNAMRERINSESKPVDSLRFVNEHQADKIIYLEQRVLQLESDLKRAGRLISSLRIAKHNLWLKVNAMNEICKDVKREFIASKSLQHAYGAIILAKRLRLLF